MQLKNHDFCLVSIPDYCADEQLVFHLRKLEVLLLLSYLFDNQ